LIAVVSRYHCADDVQLRLLFPLLLRHLAADRSSFVFSFRYCSGISPQMDLPASFLFLLSLISVVSRYHCADGIQLRLLFPLLLRHLAADGSSRCCCSRELGISVRPAFSVIVTSPLDLESSRELVGRSRLRDLGASGMFGHRDVTA